MIDILSESSQGLVVFDTLAPKAANVLSIQLGKLEYLQDFGIDLRYFLSEVIEFQNDSFKAYLVKRLADHGINATDVIEELETLFSTYRINISPEADSTGLIAR